MFRKSLGVLRCFLLCIFAWGLVPSGLSAQTLNRGHAGIIDPLDSGATCTAATLNAAIAAQGSNERILLLTNTDRAGVACTWTVTANVTLPRTMTLWVPQGAKASISSGITLTLDGPSRIDDPLWYSGAGTLLVNYRDWAVDGMSSFVVSGCVPTVPSPGALTFAAFACRGNIVSNGLFAHVNESAVVGPLNAGNGSYWLAVHRDRTTAIASWTRQAGTHYLWRLSATQPENPVGGLLFSQVTVGGGAISTAVVPRGFATSPHTSRPYVLTDPWFGAKCDGITDDAAALRKTNTLPVRSTVIIPNARCILASNVNFTKSINLKGDGPESALILAMGTGADGITVDALIGGAPNANLLYGPDWSDFAILGGENSARNCVVMRNILLANVRNVHIGCGTAATGYGVWLQDYATQSSFNFIINATYSGYPLFSWFPKNGLRAQRIDGSADGQFNANKFDLDFSVDCNGGRGLWIHTTGAAGNNDVRGTFQGIGNEAILIQGGGRGHLHDLHLEAGGCGAKNTLEVSTHAQLHLGPNVYVSPGTDLTVPTTVLTSCSGCTIDGFTGHILTLPSSDGTIFGQVTLNAQASSILQDFGSHTNFLTPVGGSSAVRRQNGVASDGSSIAVNGSAERWDTTTTIPPGSWSSVTSNPAWLLVDGGNPAVVKHGLYSAQATAIAGGATPALVILTAAQTDDLKTGAVTGQWVTFSAWAYVPSAGAVNFEAEVWYNDGVVTAGVRTITERDTWVQVMGTIEANYNGYTSAKLIFRPVSGTHTIFLDAFSVVPSLGGTASWYTPNSDEYKSFDVRVTVNPGAIAAGATVGTAVTVTGSNANDFCTLGPPAAIEAGLGWSCVVSSAGVVNVRIHNISAGSITPASATWGVRTQARP